MKKHMAIAALLGILLRGGAYAGDADAEKYFTIDASSIKIEALDETTVKGPAINPPGPVIDPPGPSIDPEVGSDTGPDINSGSSGPDIGEIIDNIGNIVNIADQVWSIIDKNKAVVNISIDYAAAVPYGTTHWTQLQGWSRPATKRYSFTAKNMLGLQSLKVIYQVHWTYGGNFHGKGKFLTGVTIEPIEVSVPWSHTVDLKAEVPDSTIANVGTSEDPIASMQVQLQWTIKPTLGHAVSQKVIYYVQGDGLLQEIGTPFKKGTEAKSDRKTEELQQKLENVRF